MCDSQHFRHQILDKKVFIIFFCQSIQIFIWKKKLFSSYYRLWKLWMWWNWRCWQKLKTNFHSVTHSFLYEKKNWILQILTGRRHGVWDFTFLYLKKKKLLRSDQLNKAKILNRKKYRQAMQTSVKCFYFEWLITEREMVCAKCEISLFIVQMSSNFTD